jgi:hypothetical protein
MFHILPQYRTYTVHMKSRIIIMSVDLFRNKVTFCYRMMTSALGLTLATSVGLLAAQASPSFLKK